MRNNLPRYANLRNGDLVEPEPNRRAIYTFCVIALAFIAILFWVDPMDTRAPNECPTEAC